MVKVLTVKFKFIWSFYTGYKMGRLSIIIESNMLVAVSVLGLTPLLVFPMKLFYILTNFDVIVIFLA
jgi:hypothetical protein